METENKNKEQKEAQKTSLLQPPEEQTEKKNKEQKEAQKTSLVQPPEEFGKREVIMFIVYYVLIIFVVSKQLNPDKSQQFDASLKNLLLTSDIKQAAPMSLHLFQILDWIQIGLFRQYYKSQEHGIFSLEDDIKRLTNLRFLTRRSISENGVKIQIPQQNDQSPYGNQNQFIYDAQNDGFQYFLHSYHKNQNESKHELNKLIKEDFFNRFVNYIQVDIVFYISNLDMVSYIVLIFNIYPTGIVDHQFKTLSIRYNQYQTIEDQIRQIIEFIIIGFYIYYFVFEFIKVKNQIDKVQRADDKKQAHLKKQGDQQEQKLSKAELLKESQRRLFNMAIGLRNHFMDIWSFFDLITIIFLGLAFAQWITFVYENEFYFTQISQLNYNLLQKIQSLNLNNHDYENIYEEKHKLQNLNAVLYRVLQNIESYSFYASITLFIMSLKVVKYIISFSQKLSDYMQIIVVIINYMMFYLVLLLSLLIAFSYLITYVYGNDINEFSTFGKTLFVIIGIISNYNLVADQMVQYSLATSFFIVLLFYMIITAIMTSNMFWVIVKNNLLKFQQERYQIESQKINIETRTHILFYIKDKLLKIYKKIFKPSSLQLEYQKIRKFERDFKNLNNNDYDIDFQDQIDNQFLFQKSGYMVEKEVKQKDKMSKVSLVKLIWSSVMLICILVLKSILVVSFFKPDIQFQNYQFLIKQIQQNNFTDQEIIKQYVNFNEISNRPELFAWLGLMADNVFIKQSLNLSQIVQSPEQIPTILSEYLHIKDTNQSDYVTQGYTINLFNILAFDEIRLTVRRSKQENNTAQWSNINPIKSSYFFSPESGSFSDLEQKEDIKGEFTNNMYAYSDFGGYKYKGGYVFQGNPDNITELLENLHLEGILNNTVNTMAVEFILVNYMEKLQFIYVRILFTFDEAGFIKNRQILVDTLNTFTYKDVYDNFLHLIFIFLCVVNIKYVLSLFRQMFHRYKAYDSWILYYIKSTLNEAQLYYRERKNPEIIRKLLFIIGIPQILQLIFVTLLSFDLIFLLLLFYLSIQMQNSTIIFDLPLFTLTTMDEIIKLFQGQTLTFEDYLEVMSWAQTVMNILKPLSGCTIIIICIQLIYNLTHNKDFNKVFIALKYIMMEIPYLLFLLFGFFLSFINFTHFTLGFQYQEFSTFYETIIILTEYLYTIKIQNLYDGTNVLTICIFLVPFIILIRFIFIPIFYTITYTGYQKMRQELNKISEEKSENSFTLKDFVIISIELFQQFFRSQKNTKDLRFLLQLVQDIDEKHLFQQIQNTFKQFPPPVAIDTWVNRCADDIKNEIYIRNLLKDQYNQTSQYAQQISEKKFEYISEINQNQKHYEYILKFKYWMFFIKFQQFYEKILIFFKNRINKQDEKIQLDDQTQQLKQKEQNLKLYIEKLEQTLEQNTQNIIILNKKLEQIIKSKN